MSLDKLWNLELRDAIKTTLPNKLNEDLLSKNLNAKASSYLRSYAKLPEISLVEKKLMTGMYLNNPQFNNIPVLNITKKQAELYCI